MVVSSGRRFVWSADARHGFDGCCGCAPVNFGQASQITRRLCLKVGSNACAVDHGIRDGTSHEQSWQFLRMEQIVAVTDADHETKNQYSSRPTAEGPNGSPNAIATGGG